MESGAVPEGEIVASVLDTVKTEIALVLSRIFNEYAKEVLAVSDLTGLEAHIVAEPRFEIAYFGKLESPDILCARTGSHNSIGHITSGYRGTLVANTDRQKSFSQTVARDPDAHSLNTSSVNR
jgi:hypothetical protein